MPSPKPSRPITFRPDEPMLKGQLKYILVLLLAMVLLVVVQLSTPPPLDWSPSFSREDKIPYGNFILFALLPDVFPRTAVSIVQDPIYTVLTGDTIDAEARLNRNYASGSDDADDAYDDYRDAEPDSAATFDSASTRSLFRSKSAITQRSTTYMFIGGNYVGSFLPDKLDVEYLLQFVSEGNTVFIAAQRFDASFLDTLRLRVGNYYEVANLGVKTDNAETGGGLSLESKLDSLGINFINPALRAKSDYRTRRTDGSHAYFTRFDSLKAEALGMNSKGYVNYLRLRFGKGFFYLNTVPYAFTNYNLMMAPNSEYVFKALSYLPVQPVLWDEFYKVGRRESRTPLRYILSNEALRWAYYLTIASALLFITFESKRRQRIIPVVAPPPNMAVEFVETVGRLYYQNGDHKDLATKKITFFLDDLRSSYMVRTTAFDAEFYETLARKSGIAESDLKTLFTFITQQGMRSSVSEIDLKQLSAMIDNFYKKSN
ncbi:MAG: hypothetical protein IAF08_05475 [Rhizobacter sp.]|nr:hypothetical protein [Chlorobiales bacterium]